MYEGVTMKIKRLIYVMMSNKVQVFIERRRKFEVNRWDGEVEYSINVDAKESLGVDILRNCWEEFIHQDEYASVLLLTEKSSPTMDNIRTILEDSVSNHNANLESDAICEWTEEDIQTIINAYEGTLLFEEGEILDDTIIHSSGILQIIAGQGSTYVIPKVVVLENKESSTSIKQDSEVATAVESTPIVSEQHRNERKQKKKNKNTSKSQVAKVKGVPEVSFADTTPILKEEKIRVSDNVNSKQEDLVEQVGTTRSKEKASNEDISNYMKEDTKDFNHDVRSPK